MNFFGGRLASKIKAGNLRSMFLWIILPLVFALLVLAWILMLSVGGRVGIEVNNEQMEFCVA